MKKILKIAGIAAAVLIVVSFIVPFLIPADAYKNFMLKRASQSINATIELGSMRIKLLPMPGFTLKDVLVTNKGGPFDGKEMIKAGEITGDISLMPLFSRRISASLTLRSPEIFYRVSKSGVTNFDNLVPTKTSLGPMNRATAVVAPFTIHDGGLLISSAIAATKKKPAAKPESKESPAQSKTSSESTTTSSPPWALDVRGLKITNGLLEYASEGEKPLIMKEFDLEINGYSTDGKKATPISIAAAVLGSEKQNFKVSGGVLFNANERVAKLNKLTLLLDSTKVTVNGSASLDGAMPIEAEIDLAPINIPELKRYFPALSSVASIKDPKVVLKVRGPAKTPASLNVAGNIEAPYIKYQDYEISGLRAAASYSRGKLSLTSLTGSLYDGKLTGSGNFIMRGEPAYDTDVSITNVDIAKIPAVKGQIKGIGTVNVKAEGAGTTEEAIKKNLKAIGSMHLANGDIPSLKLGQKIFGNPVWNILANTNTIINRKGLEELRGLDASCTNFDLTFNVAGGVIDTPVVKWMNPKYRVNLAGSVTMSEQLSYKGEFALLKDPTDRLIMNQSAKGMLTNRSGELAVPFSVDGPVSDPSVKPDEKYLAGLFTKVVAQSVAGKVIDDVKNVVPNAADSGKKLIQGIFGR